jgi:polar amino acid transport system substrate-binding protein
MKQRLANLSLALILAVVSATITVMLRHQSAHPRPGGRRIVQGWIAPSLPDGERRRLRFLLRADCPPFSHLPPDSSEPVGLDADTARLLARRLGVECDLIGIPQRDIAERFLHGEGDVLMAAMGPGSDYEYALDFTVPRYRSRGVLVVPEHLRDGLSGGLPEPFRFCMLPGAASGTKLPQNLQLPEQALEPDDWTSLTSALAEGRYDAMLTDALTAYHMLSTHPEQKLCLLPVPIPNRHPSAVCLAVRKGSGELRHSLDTALRDLRMNGGLRNIHHRYFPFDIE